MQTEISHSVKRLDCKQGAERDLITNFSRRKKRRPRKRVPSTICILLYLFSFIHMRRRSERNDLRRCVTSHSRLIIAFNVFQERETKTYKKKNRENWKENKEVQTHHWNANKRAAETRIILTDLQRNMSKCLLYNEWPWTNFGNHLMPMRRNWNHDSF